ncbi:hypothetical protein V9K67_01260 [Paraflavisolibacter sp. H34]|uniref:cupin domain-containing protein n=1 Tax=Huijunlia imazamoxiresistens TaxID=3127457 RepID=UPI0030193F44
MTTLLSDIQDIKISKEDRFIKAQGGINYNTQNPSQKLMRAMEDAYFFAEHLHCYQADSFQFLFPYSDLQLWGPAGIDMDNLNPVNQDNKTDFQKQNIKDFLLTDTFLVRGWVNIDGVARPFLKLSYTGGPDSLLSSFSGHKLDSFIFLHLKVGNNEAPDLIKVPYNNDTNRYEIEIWTHPDFNALRNQLSDKGKAALQAGNLIVRNDLVKGQKSDFDRDNLADRNMYEVAPENTMHPIRTLRVEFAWTDHTKTYWDSRNSQNYQYEFSMILRGYDHFMQGGVSANPHGGTGFLHYRNLLSNYKTYSDISELGRPVMPWMFDADGHKSGGVKEERALSVEYMDLHILKADCNIGIHRHRDNQEVFFLLTGKAYMMVGDWYEFPHRQRAFEIRSLLPGSLALLKAGQLHCLVNALDIDSTLLMFGGYD